MNNTLEELNIEIGAKSNTNGIDTTISKLNNLKNVTDENSSATQRLGNAVRKSDEGWNNRKIESYANAAQNAGDKIAAAAEKTSSSSGKFSKLSSSFATLSSDVRKVGSSLLNSFGKTTLNGLKSLGSASAKLIGNFFGIGKSSKSSGNVISSVFGNKGIRTIKRYGLALLGVRSTFTALRKAVSSYMNYDTALNDQLQNNWAVLGSLLAPAIEKIISLFTIVVSYIASFVKAFTGIDLVARANSKSMKKLGDSAKSALGNLAKFDELNTVDFGNDSGSSLSPLTIDDIDVSPIDKLIEKLKSNDWYGLGMEIGLKLNQGLSNIDFGALDEKISVWGTHIADLMNGLFDGIDWNKIGETIANGLNIAINTAFNFVKRYNWGNFGKAIGTSLSSAISSIEWDKLGEIIGTSITGIFNEISNFTKSFNEKKFTTSITNMLRSAISNIDIEKISETLVNVFSKIFSLLYTFITTMPTEELGESLKIFIVNGIYNIGKKIKTTNWTEVGYQLTYKLCDTIEKMDPIKIANSVLYLIAMVNITTLKLMGGLLYGFCDWIYHKIKDEFEKKDWKRIAIDIVLGIFKVITGYWIIELAYKHLVEPLIKGVKDGLGIHSPSTVFAEIGKNLILGLFNGIGDIWAKVKEKFDDFKSKVKEKFNEIKTDIGTKVGEWKDKIKNTFSWDNIKSTVTTMVDKVKNKFNEIKNFKFEDVKVKVTAKLDDFKTKVSKIINNNDIISSVLGWAKSKISSAKSWLASLDTGTNYVPEDQLAYIHKGEAVIPKKFNSSEYFERGNDNTEKLLSTLINKVDSMYSLVENTDFTNIVNVGNKQLYNETVKYIQKQNNIYGTNAIRA